ncbi:hypothetical protein LBMAG53_28790 [Planctomycetota bacterium]|nr:hypothetical protein LBMAG53_28790 [Planctomycetota bacterium]
MIACEGLSIRQGQFRIDGISLNIPMGAYGVLMGATGCGKTTVLEAICGLRRPAAGRILVAGEEVTHRPPGARGLGYVPQDGALFPTMDVRSHLAFAPRVQGWPRSAIAARAADLAGRLGIGHLLDRRVQGLSGGERQRVALGRALAARPAALLMDEPLSALDESARAGMITLLRAIQRDEGVTVLHVTHNPIEAEALADLRLTLADGRISG